MPIDVICSGCHWHRNLHWLLLLTLIPLAFALLQARPKDLNERLKITLEMASPEERTRAVKGLNELPENRSGFEKMFALLPGNKLDGAFLARNSQVQWFLALGSIVLFLGFFAVLTLTGSANPIHLLLVAMSTATVGMVLLLGFQAVAAWTQGVSVRAQLVLVLLFYLVRMIGLSYQMALSSDFGFFSSFLGFTFGVGLCEGVVKLLPVLARVREDEKLTGNGAFLWGLASGAGFGIAEGIIYSSNYDNGVAGWETYAVRFISSVGLHAVWTGSAAIVLYQSRSMFHSLKAWPEVVCAAVVPLAVPTALHGLYDTMLKKDMEIGALAVAVFSFAFLAYQNPWLHSEDARGATDQMAPENESEQAQGGVSQDRPPILENQPTYLKDRI